MIEINKPKKIYWGVLLAIASKYNLSTTALLFLRITLLVLCFAPLGSGLVIYFILWLIIRNYNNDKILEDTQKHHILNVEPKKVQFKEWWSERTKKQKIWIVVGCLFFIGLISNLFSGPSIPDELMGKKLYSDGRDWLRINEDNTFEFHHYGIGINPDTWTFTGDIGSGDYEENEYGEELRVFQLLPSRPIEYHPSYNYKKTTFENKLYIKEGKWCSSCPNEFRVYLQSTGFNTIKGREEKTKQWFRFKGGI